MRRRDDRPAAQYPPSLEKRLAERQAARAAKFLADNPVRLFDPTPIPRMSLLESPQESVALLHEGAVPTSDLDRDFWTERALLDDPRYAFPWPLPADAVNGIAANLPGEFQAEAAHLVVASARALRCERHKVGARGYVNDQPTREVSDLREAFRLVMACRDRLSTAAREHLGASVKRQTLVALQMVDVALLHDPTLRSLPADTTPDGHAGRLLEKRIALALHDVFARAFEGRRKPFSFNSWHNQCRAALGLPELTEKSAHEKFMRRARASQIAP